MSDIKVIQTTKDTTDKLTEKAPLETGKKGPGATLSIDPDKTYQTVVGFGGAFTESAAYTLYRMEPEKQAEIIKSYFDQEEGIGYSIGRIHMNSCDFSLGNYTYVEENDWDLATFDISREKKWVIPFIKSANSTRGEEIKLLSSPWSPPAWMKTNGEMNHGGKLLPECRDIWARYYAKFIKAMRSEGINIWAITVQNEPAATQPWDSCIYTAEDERDFVRDHLGPTLEKEDLTDVKLYIWDHNRDILVERASTVLNDPEAAKYVYGTANHWYLSEAFDNLSTLHDLFPDKHILFSEGCQEHGTHIGAWGPGERYGRNMIGDFNNWQEGWIDWNLILDEQGGPNHVGNFCSAPIIADTKTQELHYNPSYYYIGHFSKFVKPGAVRIDVTVEGSANVEQVAFKNPDGNIAIIAMNATDGEESFNIGLSGEYSAYALPAHSIATFIL